MIFRSLAALTFSACVAVAQGAPRPAAAPPTYQPGIDVLDYDIALELPDTGAFLRGDVTVVLRRSSGVSRLRLDLVDALTVRSVEVGGRAVPATHANGKIEVPLDAPGDSLRVRVVYEGIVSDGLVVRKDARGRWTWFGDNWPDRARQWLPTVDHPSDKATVSWRVKVPVGRTVVANGLLVSSHAVARPGVPRMTEWMWRESRPIATYLMVIAAGPLEKTDLREADCHYGDEGQCVRQSIYTMPEEKSWLPGPFTAAGPIVSLFERLVGPFPYEKLAHLQSSTRFGGMENASAIFYADGPFRGLGTDAGTIAHETAHQWFGDAVTEREWGHVWLSEGFATYFEQLWTRHALGDSAFRRELVATRAQILRDNAVATRPVIDTEQTNLLALLNANSYQKGGWTLHMLRTIVGDSAFFRGVREYWTSHRHATALTDDLMASLERSSGTKLGWFFDQWLRRPGYASLTIAWRYDPAQHRVLLDVAQDERFAPYRLPLTIAVTDALGAVHTVRVEIPAQRSATITLPLELSAAPRRMVYDPDVELLAEIREK